jgi:calcineurin-like phosphoesterase family protein
MKREKQIWFTSDTHFGHKNIIKFSSRPFKDENHMDEELVKSWNEVVHKDDDVYHLGDVSLGNPTKLTDILNRLNGNIHLITGNHEKSVFKKTTNVERFVWIKNYHEMTVDKQFIVMCHYGFRVWNKSHHGSWMVYGHSHDSMEDEVWGRSMDVGVDSAARITGEYRPFSYREISNIMEKRRHNPVDHHLELKLRKEGHIK